MKKFLYILAAVLLLASCEKDPFEEFLAKKSHSSAVHAIWDIAPLELAFEVTDRQGNNLFDESTPGNWLATPFLATFDGKEFRWPVSTPEVGTKAVLAVLKGFYINPQWWYPESDGVYLRFGKLDRTEKWDTQLRINWPDRSVDVIWIRNAFRWDEEGYPDYYTEIKVNGKPVEGPIIRLAK